MTKGQLIGKGRTAEVYEYKEQYALKLYHPTYPTHWIEAESEISKAIEEAGVPAPSVFGIVEEGGRKGLLYSRIPGLSMAAALRARPRNLFQYAREMARLHYRIHSCFSSELPRQKDTLAQAIREAEPLLKGNTEIICRYLCMLPEDQRICHGDFHPDNILMTNKGSVAIDWTNASTGHPLCDVARTSMMFLSPARLPETTVLQAIPVRFIKRMLNRIYLKEYGRLTEMDMEQVSSWMLPVAAARLRENIPEEKEWLRRLIERLLHKLN